MRRAFPTLLVGLGLVTATLTPNVSGAVSPAQRLLLLKKKTLPRVPADGNSVSTSLGALINRDVYIGKTSSLGLGADTKQLTMSFWINGTIDDQNPTNFLNGAILVTDPNGTCEVSAGSNNAPGLCVTFDSTSNVNLAFNFNDATGVNDNANSIKFLGGNGHAAQPSPGVWTHYLCSFDAATSAAACYKNGVNATANGDIVTTKLNNTIAFINGGTAPKGFYFGNLPGVVNSLQFAWFSDVVLARESIACTGVGTPFADCAGANTIPPSKLSGFISGGKPVALGATCSNPTGRQPEICLSGDGDDLIVNKGSAGNIFSVASLGIGGIQDPGSKKIFPAPYGPAGMTANQPTLKWIQQSAGGGAKTSPITVSKASMPIAVGDLLILAGTGNDNTNAGARPVTCPSGWSLLQAAYDTGEFNDAWACYHIANSTDAAASSFTATWTGGDYTFRWGALLMDYAQVGSVDVADAVTGASSTHMISKSGLTADTAGETLVNIFINPQANGVTYTPPSQGALRVREINGASKVQMIVVDEYGLGAGAAPTREVTRQSADSFQVLTFTLRPAS